MYCPSCFNDSLFIKPKGVIEVKINGKQMDTGRFLFNLSDSKKQEVVIDLFKKLNDFFKWYSSFKNADPIKKIELVTSDFRCDGGCIVSLDKTFSIVGVLIPEEILKEKVTQLCQHYKLSIEFD